MAVRFFRGMRIRFEHEYLQVREIARLLEEAFPGEPVFVFTNFLLANGEVDALILTVKGPVLLELKSLRGVITGAENGPWSVKTRKGTIQIPNVFMQAKTHRTDFIERLQSVAPAVTPHIDVAFFRRTASWAYFCKESSYPDGQINTRKVKWFRVVTSETLIEKLWFLDSGYTLRQVDMEKIASALGLEEYNFDTDRPVTPREERRRSLLSPRGWQLLAIALLVLLVIATIPPVTIMFRDAGTGFFSFTGNAIRQYQDNFSKSQSNIEDSVDATGYLNEFRKANGIPPVMHDERAFQLALVRAQDMARYHYLNYINPSTGTCADTLKSRFGLSEGDYCTENIYGQWTGYGQGLEKRAIDAWVSEPINLQVLLYPGNRAGAVACAGGYCSLVGINNNSSYKGCRSF